MERSVVLCSHGAVRCGAARPVVGCTNTYLGIIHSDLLTLELGLSTRKSHLVVPYAPPYIHAWLSAESGRPVCEIDR